MKITVREATAADIPGAIHALVDGFSKDPVMSGALGGSMKIERIRALFELQIRTQYSHTDQGRVDVAVDTSGKVLGAALWATPHKSTSFVDELKQVGEYVQVLRGSLISAALTEYKLLKARPVFKHWYLYTIGVHEDARGHGVGSALLDFRREQLGEYPAYLEASTYNSAALYKRHGFVELGGYGKLSKAAIGMWHPAPISSIDKNHATTR
ncbi:GNAT family N-acetyltransferase [Rothia sp. ZJ1223]|uniref:GNAT family N-acetyltransferase n=1 Tax=Rothia sp. ZJ1223 TaxID=2811098 RepID=UPI00195C0C5E|nr:GNAT family N-acetyltransferase [Rothia sp. ZJ1223]MBM7051868.1 GNAT family N-acetyltransferase [Rothia sp. ZJ1223]